jgi:hypothetical protein
MSILLFVIGTITLVLGALAIGFGIPINEFSFGNTLIMAGATAAVGGLIVIGLGAVVSHLQRVAEVIAMRAPLRPNRAPDVVDTGRAPPPTSRTLFPPKQQKPEPAMEQVPAGEPPFTAPAPAVMFAEEMPAEEKTPTLPNPVEPLAEAIEEAPPPSRPFFAAKPPGRAELNPPAASAGRLRFGANGAGAGEPAPEPVPAWLTAPRTPEPPSPEPPEAPEEASFEAVWPVSGTRTADDHLAAEANQPPAAAKPTAPETTREPAAPASERRNVAILKSGVVDGMGYTLYVDGSIEAELPQGTLRFASINDLREHLEKAS